MLKELNASRHLLTLLKKILQIFMIQESNIQCVGDLPPKAVVHDMSFDWTGRRLAAACSDKVIRMYIKKGDKWVEDKAITIQGASAWKVKWARPQFGTIIATCSLDTQIRIYECKKTDKGDGEKYQWSLVNSRSQHKAIEDIKFIPTKSQGLCLAYACSDGTLRVLIADPVKPKEWHFDTHLVVNELGLSCLSWSKNITKEDESVLAVGCKNLQTSPKKVVNHMTIYVKDQRPDQQHIENTNTVVFINFNRSLPKNLQKINVPKIKQSKTINDISWALLNGRSYHLLGIASDAFVKIFQINIKEVQKDLPTIDVLKEMQLSYEPCMRLSWNIMGTYLSASEKKKIRIWRCVSRGVWTVLEGIES